MFLFATPVIPILLLVLAEISPFDELLSVLVSFPLFESSLLIEIKASSRLFECTSGTKSGSF